MTSTATFTTRADYDQAVTQLAEAARAYYDGDGDVVMTDGDYDQLVRRVAATAEQHPDWVTDTAAGLTGAVAGGVSTGGDITHTAPMGSLDNVYSADELAEWANRLNTVADADPDTVKLVVEPKLDGLAIAARYIDSRLTIAITRGDGTAGEDVTAQVRGAAGLPDELDVPGQTVEIRGELYLTHAGFEAANEARVASGKNAFVNPRNAAAGAVRNRNRDYNVPFSFAAYTIVGELAGRNADNWGHAASMLFLQRAGVQTAMGLLGHVTEVTGVNAAADRIAEIGELRASLGFDIDGAVVKADNPSVRREAGSGTKAPKWAIAYKYPADTAFAELLAIDWQIGRTGVVTPVARIAPTFVGGTTISNVTLHNWAFIAQHDLRPGDTVVIRRAGEVIPQVVGRHGDHPEGSEPYPEPQVCPVTGAELDKSEVRWRTTDPTASIGAWVRYYASRDAMDIEQLGTTLIDQLIEHDLITSPADLYQLTVDQISGLDRMGAASAAKVTANIAASKTQPLSRLVTGLGLRMTGRRMSRRIARHFGTLDAIVAATEGDFTTIEGFGEARARSVVREIAAKADVIAALVAAGVTTVEPNTANDADGGELPLAGKAVVVTGTVPGLSRNEAQEAVEKLGGRAASSVSAKTDLVVVGDGAGSKADKAAKLGITIMDAAEFAALAAQHT